MKTLLPNSPSAEPCHSVSIENSLVIKIWTLDLRATRAVPPKAKNPGKMLTPPHFSPVFLRFSEFFNFPLDEPTKSPDHPEHCSLSPRNLPLPSILFQPSTLPPFRSFSLVSISAR